MGSLRYFRPSIVIHNSATINTENCCIDDSSHLEEVLVYPTSLLDDLFVVLSTMITASLFGIT